MKKPIVSFQNYSFKYRSQQEPTLEQIDLQINQGEKVLIVGPSGSGKSTLGHCINGLVPFSYKGEATGTLQVAGEETKDLDVFSLSKKVGTVLQDPDGQFIGLTVGEDIAFSLENDGVPQAEMTDIVDQVAKLVEIESHLDYSLHELSGGQKQRVALGGVMVDDVDILLFDEPLANLDPKSGKHAIELIDQIHKEHQKTIIIIEHRLEDVLHMEVDRLVVVDEGRIVANGHPDDILATSVLEDTFIREPLYVKACKYAGCDITSEMKPSHLNQFDVQSCKENLQIWDQKQVSKSTTIEHEPILQIDHISFQYDEDVRLIQDVAFEIHKGEMVSIVGRNGAGKSTLAKLICGFEKVSQGRIVYNDEDITKEGIKKRAEKIGYVMQNPNHMISKHMIYEEVALGLELRGVPIEEIKERVEHTLKICGLYPFRNWPISALSFGQKKRVTIASILVLNPEVIILDEPTAGQDFKHYTDIMEFLTKLNAEGVTIIMITHDMHLMLEYTDRTLVIVNGKLLMDGSSVDVLTTNDIVDAANLKQTSLFDLAVKAEIENPRAFVHHFIDYDRGVRQSWQ